MTMRNLVGRAAWLCAAAAFLVSARPSGAARAADFAHAPIAYKHIFTGADGRAHLEILHWNGTLISSKAFPGALQGFFSAKAKRVFVISIKPGVGTPEHNSNGMREFSVVMGGSATVYLSDGTSSVMKAGDIVLIEDRTGPGARIVFGPDGYLALTSILAP